MMALINRSNINVKNINEKNIIVYEDHRVILNILRHALDNKKLTSKPNLIILDYHDDAKTPTCDRARLLSIRNGNMSINDFWNFVEWEVSGLDDDWLLSGMDLGLIGDALLIGVEEDDNITSNRITYQDVTGEDHTIYSRTHIWDGLRHNGWLLDYARGGELQSIWEILGSSSYSAERNTSRLQGEKRYGGGKTTSCQPIPKAAAVFCGLVAF